MADGASPLTGNENITVEKTRNSGSAKYVDFKNRGEHFIDFMARYHDFIGKNAAAIDTHMESVARLMRAFEAPFRASYRAAGGGDLPENPWVTATEATGKLSKALAKMQEDAFKANMKSSVFCSPEYAKFMLREGIKELPDEEVNAKLNDRFFTHNSTQEKDNRDGAPPGSLNLVKPTDIQAQFNQSDTSKWPNLILTSSHALVRDHKDVSDVMKGFHAMITQAYGSGEGNDRGKDLPLIRKLGGASPVIDAGTGKPTLMVSAVYNDRNALVNGGTLLLRMHHLDEVGRKYTSLKPSAQERAEMERDYLGYEHDQGDKLGGTQMSHASINLGKLILSLIVENSDDLGPVNARDNLEFYRKPLIEYDPPLKLRPDADQVLQHIKLAGYSKGGTIVTDALRFLALQLEHPNDLGKSSFVDHTGKTIDHTDITRMMSHMGILCVNPGITPLSIREQDLGIRRMSVRNDNDIVTSHLFANYAKEEKLRIKVDASGDYDNVYVVNGTKDHLGHGIEDALGSRDKPGYIMNSGGEESEVKMQVKSRLQSFFASCYDKVGISQVKLSAQGGDSYILDFELSTGVPYKDFVGSTQQQVVIEKLKGASFISPTMKPSLKEGEPYKGQILFTAPKGLDVAQACRDALAKLNTLPEQNIFISRTSLNQLAPERPNRKADMQAAAHGGHVRQPVLQVG